ACLFLAVALSLAGGVPAALAFTGRQRAESFARAEVAHYAKGLPASLAAAPGSSLDRECFSPAESHVDAKPGPGGQPTNPAWYQRDALNQYCATLRLRDQ